VGFRYAFADDFSDTGFHEVWLADHFYSRAIREVRLIGLYPLRVFGIHHQPALEGKALWMIRKDKAEL